ncbi:MAG: hypothetical protein KBE04_13000 [Phycisphaerae bacterium]|nr:hypothetical protein [Phycisphaerae bacterium]
MRADRIEQLMMTLRIRSRLNNRQGKLDDILAAYDRSRPSRVPSARWAAKAAIAACTAVIVAVVAVMHRSPDNEQKTMVMFSSAELITAGSLQTAFYQAGLDGVERHLDRAAELFGPWPAVLQEQDTL